MGLFYALNFYNMIYKLKQENTTMLLEIELFNKIKSIINEDEPDVVSFMIGEEENFLQGYEIRLNKIQVYRLIGVLHMLHKEMK
jgi:hypothetical protein